MLYKLSTLKVNYSLKAMHITFNMNRFTKDSTVPAFRCGKLYLQPEESKGYLCGSCCICRCMAPMGKDNMTSHGNNDQSCGPLSCQLDKHTSAACILPSYDFLPGNSIGAVLSRGVLIYRYILYWWPI